MLKQKQYTKKQSITKPTRTHKNKQPRKKSIRQQTSIRHTSTKSATTIQNTPNTAKKSYFIEALERGDSILDVGSNKSPFVSTTWVKQHLPESKKGKFKIFNCSWQMAFDTTSLSLYQSFLSSRLPGALHLDLEESSQSDSHKPLAFSSPQQYATAFGRLGIDNTTSLVLYDYNGLLGAAYANFLITALGLPQENVRILKGGWLSWIQDVHNPVSHEEIIPPVPTTFIPSPDVYKHMVTDHEMFDLGYAHHVAQQNNFIAPDLPMIIDTRSKLRFQGLMKEPIGFHNIEAGHIPGSVNVPYATMLCEVGGPGIALKHQSDLYDVFEPIGITPLTPKTTPFIVTSGTGATAAVAYMALKSLGFQNVRLYESGWLVYGYKACYPENPRPIEVGDSLRLHLM